MFGIISGLLSGWILGLFGFQGVVIAGMAQVFGVTINALGYYFMFAMFGVVKSIIMTIKNKPVKINFDELKDKNKK